jgi:hypothetical protein
MTASFFVSSTCIAEADIQKLFLVYAEGAVEVKRYRWSLSYLCPVHVLHNLQLLAYMDLKDAVQCRSEH